MEVKTSEAESRDLSGNLARWMYSFGTLTKFLVMFICFHSFNILHRLKKSRIRYTLNHSINADRSTNTKKNPIKIKKIMDEPFVFENCVIAGKY